MDFDLTEDQSLLADSVRKMFADGYGFEQRLQGYAQTPQLTKYLQDSIAFVDAQGFLKPKLPQLIERLGGKSKMFAAALVDWPDVST